MANPKSTPLSAPLAFKLLYSIKLNTYKLMVVELIRCAKMSSSSSGLCSNSSSNCNKATVSTKPKNNRMVAGFLLASLYASSCSGMWFEMTKKRVKLRMGIGNITAAIILITSLKVRISSYPRKIRYTKITAETPSIMKKALFKTFSLIMSPYPNLCALINVMSCVCCCCNTL